jgi:predicted nucleic acid-binding protein
MVTPAPPARGLIDTPVLIAYRDGWPDAVAFLAAVRQNGQPECSQISALALFAWCQDAMDVSAVRAFLALTTVYAVTAQTMRRALRILERHPPPMGLTPDDAIVAATAIEQSLPLYTLDPARFANVTGLAALQPY